MYETRRTLKRQLVEQRDRVMRMAMKHEADQARITSLNQAVEKRIIENIDLHNQITALQMDLATLRRNKELLEEWAALSRESNLRRGEALGKIRSIIEQRTDLVAKPDDDTPILTPLDRLGDDLS